MGDVSLAPPPKFRYGFTSIVSIPSATIYIFARTLASNEMAWQMSRGRPGFVSSQSLAEPLAADLLWGTAATQHAVSWPHVDDEGFATVVSVQAGSKYWVVGKPKRGSEAADVHGLGNMETINSFCVGNTRIQDKEWQPGGDNTHLVDYEGVLLTPGTVL
jgi:hypothetical protein